MVTPTAPLHLAPYPQTGGAMGVRNEADTLGPKLYLETYIMAIIKKYELVLTSANVLIMSTKLQLLIMIQIRKWLHYPLTRPQPQPPTPGAGGGGLKSIIN